MLREIKKYGDPVLKKSAEKVETVDDDIRTILSDMAETMYEAPGVGLAAPQIGIGKRLVVIDVDGILRKIVNPVILEYSQDIENSEEGCLSVPGVYEKVKRAKKITVKYKNENGEEVIEEAEGLLARAFQHELDHLDGVLFVDKLSPIGKKLASQKLMRLKKDTLKKLKKGDKE